ncbi:hypothetical protein [Pedobacter cryoconitis]|uniref:Uncharacterized protein n=1 Tax=Pedobacter cryoconitis TaxID=188932 RepID=A0A327SKY4_9SPHI|nr:hypothetical protein [Pedobacter cryoconitis]RAJ26397.1 hypothetical protein LY11_03841 [Pedobacter cryoconitis]
MKKSQFVYPLLLVLAYGCQQKPSGEHASHVKTANLTQQPNDGMNYSDSITRLYSENAYAILSEHHYKFPSSTDFEQTTHDIYHIDVKPAKFDDVLLSTDEGPAPVAVRQKNFIYIFDHFGDAEPNIDKALTYHLNNYLFNKDMGSRNLLLNSKNKGYLFDLVEKYGYAKDEYLLNYILDKKYKNIDSFEKLGSILFIKKPDGDLEIRTAILNFIAAKTNKSDVILARNILLYCINLIDNRKESEFTAPQIAKIIAFAANSIDPIYKKYHGINDQHWGTASILSYYLANIGEQQWNEVEAGYLKKKYYDLANLSAMIAYATQFDQIGAPD